MDLNITSFFYLVNKNILKKDMFFPKRNKRNIGIYKHKKCISEKEINNEGTSDATGHHQNKISAEPCQ